MACRSRPLAHPTAAVGENAARLALVDDAAASLLAVRLGDDASLLGAKLEHVVEAEDDDDCETHSGTMHSARMD